MPKKDKILKQQENPSSTELNEQEQIEEGYKLLDTGEFIAAVNHISAIEELDSYALFAYGFALLKIARYDKALEVLNKADENNSDIVYLQKKSTSLLFNK